MEGIDWVGGLADETWREVAARLGLHALTLRRTCAALQRRVLALEELPVSIQLARRVLQLMDAHLVVEAEAEAEAEAGCYGAACHTVQENVSLHDALWRAGPHDLFGMLGALNCNTRLPGSKRRCFQVLVQLRGCALWKIFEQRASQIARLDTHWNGERLSDDAFLDVMRRFRDINVLPTAGLFADGDGQCTSTWHLAASRGDLEVLRFLAEQCAQPLHGRTVGGNNALAHARRGLERARDFFDDAFPERAAQVSARYAPVIAFLKRCGLEDHGWRDPDGDALAEASDDSAGSEMDMLETALGALQSAG